MADTSEYGYPEHWTVEAVGRSAKYSANPLWGHIAEDDYGDLLLPAWRHGCTDPCCEGCWNRPLNLRRPTHWLPYLRSRLTRQVAMVERQSGGSQGGADHG